MHYEIEINGHKISLEKKGRDILIVGNDEEYNTVSNGDRHLIYIGAKIHQVDVIKKEDKNIVLLVNDKMVEVRVKDENDLLLEKLGINQISESKVGEVKAPMPGVILKISIELGQHVQKGDALIILEAMKMENIIKAPFDGQVESINVSKGESVEKNTTLIQLA